MEVGNAYFRSLSLQNVRCFGGDQQLSFKDRSGVPARWTLILGDNGVGKTTLLQLLALGAAQAHSMRTPNGKQFTASPQLADTFWFPDLMRTSEPKTRVAYQVLWAEAFDQSSIIYGYGANRRRAPKGFTAETSDDPVKILFDDDATLRNPEEWLLQNELSQIRHLLSKKGPVLSEREYV